MSSIVVFELVDSVLKFNKLWIPPDGSLFLGWNLAWKTLFTELSKRLKVVDMIMLSWFVSEGRSPIDGRGIRHIALAIYTGIGLRYVLGSFDFGVSL